MNMSVVTSFAVGGIMLVSVLALSNRLMTNSNKTTLNMLTKMRMDQTADLIANDFKNIGHYYGNNEAITTFKENELTFWGGVYEDSSGTWDLTNTRVTYKADSTDKVTHTLNPDDYYLVRRAERMSGGSVAESHVSRFPVTHFEMKYFNAAGSETSTAYLIKSIEVELICEAPEPVGTNSDGSDKYERAFWKKRFYPENLQEIQ